MRKQKRQPRVEIVVWNGITFRRYPDSKYRQHRVYFQAHTKWKAPPIYLHRMIWAESHGPIPDGHVVHHKDGNSLNNSIENLELLAEADHPRRHREQGDYDTPAVQANIKNLDRIRHLASEWHGSEEGRAWHAEHGRKAFASRKPKKFVCSNCDTEFESLNLEERGNRFCSSSCFDKWRRRSGKYDEDRTCLHCGEVFRAYKYQSKKQACCSRACACSRRHALKRAAGVTGRL